ncbi:MAG: hypothetical protein PHQ34_08120, partial [Methanothrix sp.]|nr:hypothetical protein [Methanothrix sp.]
MRVCNNFSLASTDVVVEDTFERPVELVSVSPAPNSDGRWRFDGVGFGDCREITLVVRTPKRQDFKFHMGSRVEGEGFVNVANDYSTAPPSYLLINCVKAVFYLNNFTVGSYSNCAAVSINDPGTSLSSREHGIGSYESDETVKILTENKSIEMKKNVSAEHGSTALALYRNRTVTCSSRWTEEARAKNQATGASMRESYRYATSIDRESRMKLDQNESVMEVESEFSGMGHIGFLKKPTPGAGPKDSPIFNSQEDYAGSFRVMGKTDEYGSGVSSDRSASGAGFVAVDRRIKDSQRSHESGTGSYQSDEVIRSYTNYIASNLSLIYRPENQTITDDLSLNRSMKWTAGVRSRVKNSSLISEEYSSLTQLKGETIARGLNEMDSSAQFSGQARYRTVLKDKVDLDQTYAGNYSIKRKVLLGGVSKYDWPHLNLTKTGVVTQKTVVENMVEKTKDIADYTIDLENDGNRSLGPVYVKDLFPPGAVYINSSLRPQSQTSGSAEWVLTHLAIGDRAEI